MEESREDFERKMHCRVLVRDGKGTIPEKLKPSSTETQLSVERTLHKIERERMVRAATGYTFASGAVYAMQKAKLPTKMMRWNRALPKWDAVPE